MRFTWLAAVAAVAFVGQAQAAEVNPALVYDLGGKFDKSFNQAAYEGAERFKAETGIEYPRFRDPERFAARAGVPQVRARRLQPDHRHRLLDGSAR